MTSHSDQDSEGIPHNSHAAQPVEQEVEPQTNEQSAPKADAEKPKPSSNGSVIELNTLNNQHQPKDGKFDSNITITFKDVSYKVAVCFLSVFLLVESPSQSLITVFSYL